MTDEIFGPVLTVLTFRHPKEAVALANNTPFALAGSVWSQDISLCMDMAFKVWILLLLFIIFILFCILSFIFVFVLVSHITFLLFPLRSRLVLSG